jgi:hypothetical protein
MSDATQRYQHTILVGKKSSPTLPSALRRSSVVFTPPTARSRELSSRVLATGRSAITSGLVENHLDISVVQVRQRLKHVENRLGSILALVQVQCMNLDLLLQLLALRLVRIGARIGAVGGQLQARWRKVGREVLPLQGLLLLCRLVLLHCADVRRDASVGRAALRLLRNSPMLASSRMSATKFCVFSSLRVAFASRMRLCTSVVQRRQRIRRAACGA